MAIHRTEMKDFDGQHTFLVGRPVPHEKGVPTTRVRKAHVVPRSLASKGRIRRIE